MSACINPIIYVIMNKQYRQAYKSVLLCKSPRLLFTPAPSSKGGRFCSLCCLFFVYFVRESIVNFVVVDGGEFWNCFWYSFSLDTPTDCSKSNDCESEVPNLSKLMKLKI